MAFNITIEGGFFVIDSGGNEVIRKPRSEVTFERTTSTEFTFYWNVPSANGEINRFVLGSNINVFEYADLVTFTVDGVVIAPPPSARDLATLLSGYVGFFFNPDSIDVDVISSVLPTGASTEVTLSAVNTKLPSGLTVTGSRLQVELPSGGGGLTDTELRATPVPISGTVIVDTSLLATEATQTAMSAKLPATLGQKAMADSMAVVLASNQASIPVVATPIAITKGTQGATGFTVQQLNNAGRNARHFMLDAYTVAPVAEAVQSVVQWFNSVAVAGTTQPAVVTAGKTLRLTNYTISTKSLATVGSAVVRIRANTAGLAVLASPLVFSMECGSEAGATTVAMTGGSSGFSGVFPEGLEFSAGTGLAFSMAGYGPTGVLAVRGVTRFQVFGYEY